MSRQGARLRPLWGRFTDADLYRPMLGWFAPAETRVFPRLTLWMIGSVGLLCIVIWALTGAGYFWPMWPVLGMLAPYALKAELRHVVAVEAPGPRRRLRIQGVVSVHVVILLFVIWAITGANYPWPIWPVLGLLVAFGAHVFWLLYRGVDLKGGRERELSERVETLTETRRGALDVQAAELRRIERDLHDGAQARLVALSMQLGRAEEGLADRPETAELVRQARSEASAAIAELRDLARGIAPPVLSDRGLAAAVEALGSRSPLAVTVDARLPRRPAPVVESAAYFVVAESLTNVAKHAPGARATVTIRLEGEALEVVVADDGPGGADVAVGSGLDGLRRRVAALDGEFAVASPPGGGTRIEVRLPCGS